jgi:hypothetical protein
MGSGGIAPPFLISALDGGEWSASRPCRFTPALPRRIGGWVGPRVGVDTTWDMIPFRIGIRILPTPLGKQRPGTKPVCQRICIGDLKSMEITRNVLKYEMNANLDRLCS